MEISPVPGFFSVPPGGLHIQLEDCIDKKEQLLSGLSPGGVARSNAGLGPAGTQNLAKKALQMAFVFAYFAFPTFSQAFAQPNSSTSRNQKLQAALFGPNSYLK